MESTSVEMLKEDLCLSTPAEDCLVMNSTLLSDGGYPDNHSSLTHDENGDQESISPIPSPEGCNVSVIH